MTYSEEQYQDILAVCRSYKNDYDRAFERLKSQQREIDALKSENERFENNMRAVLEIEKKQAKIDVFNKIKDYINQLACEEYGDIACDINYITVDIDKFEQDIDEMIEEIEK